MQPGLNTLGQQEQPRGVGEPLKGVHEPAHIAVEIHEQHHCRLVQRSSVYTTGMGKY